SRAAHAAGALDDRVEVVQELPEVDRGRHVRGCGARNRGVALFLRALDPARGVYPEVAQRLALRVLRGLLRERLVVPSDQVLARVVVLPLEADEEIVAGRRQPPVEVRAA